MPLIKIKILSIELIKEETEVYDIEVEDDHSFVAEGIFVHNCMICGILDGKRYYFNQTDPPVLPIHPNCRCCLVPITKSWEELGADQKIQEPDAGSRPYLYTGEKPLPGSRQYISQKNKWAGDVPAEMKYSDWLKMMDEQDPSFVKGILGSGRYDLWKNDKIKFKEMVKGNKILSLDKLGEVKKGIVAETPTWKLADKINSVTLDDYIDLVKKGKIDEVMKHLDEIMATQGHDAVVHNLNDMNVVRYMFEKKMTREEIKGVLSGYIEKVRPKLYGKMETELKLPKSIKQKPMSSVKGFLNCILGIKKESLMELTVLKPDPCVDYVRDDEGRWFFKGKEISEEGLLRLKKLGIPPAWRNVVVASNPQAKIQVMGLDKAGRWQYRYSAEYVESGMREKFDRIKLFSRDMPKIRRAIEKGIKDGDPLAYLLELENKSAIRVGSLTDFKAKQKAYGLTTLKNEHIIIQKDKIILDFIAKEGKQAHYEIIDKTLASWLLERKEITKIGEDLFPDISASKLNNYLRKISGGDYTVKDFRTYYGTKIAYEELKKYAGQTLLEKEKRNVIKNVCEKVAKFLSNTANMAKKAYIDPMVWEFIGGL